MMNVKDIRRIVALTLSWLPLALFAQALTLSDCRRMAHDNYPAIRQYGLVERLRDYTVSNASKAWLPQVSIAGGAGAFTDIVAQNEMTQRMGVDMKNYVAGGAVTLRQTLYDGGQTAAGKAMARAEAETQLRQTDVTLHAVDERVEQIFFGILTLDEQLRQNRLLQDDLGVSANTVESMMRGGIANQSDRDAVSVEQLKAQQQAAALEASREAYCRMLGVLIGKSLDAGVTLERPVDAAPVSRDAWGIARPEMGYYLSQSRLVDAEHRQLNARLRPTVSLVGMGALHTRVSDAVNNGMLLGGVSLSWNIGALYTRKNDLRRLDVERLQIDTQRDVFLFNNRLENEESAGSMRSLREQIEKDAGIVALRERIRQTNEQKVKLGTESVNELLRSVNAVSSARLQQSLHELQLLQTVYHGNTINK